jgi:Ca2+-transporting ATPase
MFRWFEPESKVACTVEPFDQSETETARQWSAMSVQQTAKSLKSDNERGLSDDEPATRKLEYGCNKLEPRPERSGFKIACDQFKSVIVVLLLVAAVLSYVMGDVLEGNMILVVVLLNAVIGFCTEWKARRALSSLEARETSVCEVIRNGEHQQLAVVDLVPGDLVTLFAGNRIPADGRIVASDELYADESALTGESMAVEKTSSVLIDPEPVVSELSNMGFMGTFVTSGHGRMLVTETGAKTQLGRVGLLIAQARKRPSPMTAKLEQLGTVLLIIVVVLCVMIIVAGRFRAMPGLEMLQVAITLAIAAVPEGLLAVSTMTLAIGMQRIARKGAWIRNLASVETLGSTTIICTDKTGTLTQNQMTVEMIAVAERTITVTGAGYEPTGEFREEGSTVTVQDDQMIVNLLRTGVLCNDARVVRGANEVSGRGDPTEAALIVLAEKAGIDPVGLNAQYLRIAEKPFSSETKWMLTEHLLPDGSRLECAKGAPSRILQLSEYESWGEGARPMTAERLQRWHETNTLLADKGLRVLGLAWRRMADDNPGAIPLQEGSARWVFLGLVGITDPLRDEAGSAIALCRSAGISTVMITGDQVATAQVIAHRLGIDQGLSGESLMTTHASVVDHADPEKLRILVEQTAVFARAEPRHKLQIVEAYQKIGHVVAMTGDGVNDAAALKQADIGIAMGRTGTDVARQTADMILTDDNFATIVMAVEQGRVLYANIIRFVHYLLSCNLAELLTVFLALMFGLPLPLLPLQILWLNMITDVLPALALALEPSAPNIMKRPPRDPDAAVLSLKLILIIAWQGLLLALATIWAFYVGLERHEGTDHAVTMAFMTLGFVQALHALNTRSQYRSALTRRLFTNLWLWAAIAACVVLQLTAVYIPYMRSILGTVALDSADLAVVLGCALVPLVIVEFTKWITSPHGTDRQIIEG